MTDPSPRAAPDRADSWWDRNWKWCVPALLVGGLGAFAGLAFLVVTFVFGLVKSSVPYEEALARGRTHPAVQEALGHPIEPGFLVSGHIDTSGTSGEADLAIPIAGPRGEATVYVRAARAVGRWTLTLLIVELDPSGRRIDLLERQSRSRPAPPPRTAG